MKFKPTLLKIVVSLAVVIIWYFLLLWISNLSNCNYSPCPQTFKASDCEKVFVFNLIPKSCNGGCICPKPTTLFEIFNQLVTLLLPGIIVYLAWSFLQKNKLNKKMR
ncbi:Uncharacterised protein [uncultured archaeon]|nr:Uncharacterised protein [uncultured archaeon]